MSDFKTIFRREYDQYFDEEEDDILNLALVLEAEGLVICEIKDYRDIILRGEDLKCVDQVNSYFTFDGSALALHYEPEHPDNRLYLISATPPRVSEYDISSFENLYLSKVYLTQEAASKRYVAMNQMSVNKAQVSILLKDIYTNNYVIRTFTRDTTFFRIVLHDIKLPAQSRFPFFAYPNFFFNRFLFRDERTINITRVNPHVLSVNRSEVSL